MKTNNLSSVSYDNEFRWAYIFRLLYPTLFYVLFLILLVIVLNWIFGTENSSYLNIGFVVGMSVLFLILSMVEYVPRIRSGEYNIEGNNLMVNERYFSAETNLIIPISSISKVRYMSYWNGFTRSKGAPVFSPFRFIEITVGEKKFVLHSITHSKELCEELNKRIENNTNF